MSQHISRRTFLGATAASGAALFTGGIASLSRAVAPASGDFPWSEATIPQLQAAMASGKLSSNELTRGYINRIASLNPLLHAVIEINPNAISIAAGLDNERRRGKVRGPLHGIPVLLKDNIATKDNMQTLAGSIALFNSKVPADAVLVNRLRNAGAVILGKANLGEWANFRGFNPFGFWGWSARGGATYNPYLLSYTSGGSSSGSAVAVAANLCSAAVGTETDGSISFPANVNLIVGLKPTLGLVSQEGIIPISHNQDTAGPMGRTVLDVAILLGTLQSPFGPVLAPPQPVLPSDYTQFLNRGALNGARIGVDRRFCDPSDLTMPYVEDALNAMTALGATVVETDTGDLSHYGGDEFTALLFEFKVHMAEYLAGLTHTNMRSLADLIEFNIDHCPAELVYFGQELFEMADSTSGDLADPVHVAARTHAFESARNGIDGALARDNLDAIVAPQGTNSTAPAVAGYPNIALPVGITSAGSPAGIMMYGTFLSEPSLLAYAYDLEQEMQVRMPPQFLGSASDQPKADICGKLNVPHVFTGKAHLPHGRLFI